MDAAHAFLQRQLGAAINQTAGSAPWRALDSRRMPEAPGKATGSIAERLVCGDKRALARAISLVSTR
jgi:hypothetical protein